ncbi:MAG TPA: hypothetical protein VJ597_07620 [Sphingomicrobium sp.]|nr:hypothetical protein [Sphingomicrobium sp.]
MKHSSIQTVRDLVAAADRRRRARSADRLLAKLAPISAGILLAVALVARFAGWNRWIGLAGLVLAVAGFGVLAILTRRTRPTTDAIAASVDDDAGLRGELRSAHWFESLSGSAGSAGSSGSEGSEEWEAYHVRQAIDRASRVDWPSLYPSIRAARQWAVTAVAVVAIVAVAVRFPARASADPAAAALGDPALAAALPPELRDKLAALMEQLEKGVLDKDAKQISLEEMKALLAKLDPALQKKLAELLEKKMLGQEANNKRKDLDADERAERADNSAAGLPEDVRWALEDMAARMAQQSQDRQTNAKNPSASSETGEKGMGSAQAEQKMASMSEASSPLVREAAQDPGGKMMMGGGGPMGGDSRPGAGGNQGAEKGAADALLLAQALRKELLEASSDALGENVDKEDRRKKTEQGKSTLGYTRVAPPAAYEPSRAAAPPPVPEARRQLLLNYFIRK